VAEGAFVLGRAFRPFVVMGIEVLPEIGKRFCIYVIASSFLTFQLTAEPKMEALTVQMTGPDGAKEFLKSVLV